jgi:hypothetical protein
MKYPQTLQLTLGLCLVASASLAQAQSTTAISTQAPMTREQVKMDRNEFLKSHTWDVRNNVWTLKPGYEAPEGVKSRADVKTERDKFLGANKWDRHTSQWVAISGTPRPMSSLTREQVKTETDQFMRMYSWDEETGAWVRNSARTVKQ